MDSEIFYNLVEQQDNCPASVPTLNDLEHNTIRSLIAYTAYSHKKAEALIEAATLEKFKTDAVNNIERKDFDEAIRYLVDLQPNELVN